MNKTVAAAALALAVSVPAITGSAVELQVSGGILTGALEVNVGGTLYDVSFVDDTCAAVFSGCDQISDFTFTTNLAAAAAGQALFDTVLVDTPDGMFDSNPNLTLGCPGDPNVPDLCQIFIPFDTTGTLVSGRLASNAALESSDVVGGFFGAMTPAFDTSDDHGGFFVWAVFTPSQVPEPSALVLLGIGLAGLVFSHRKRGV